MTSPNNTRCRRLRSHLTGEKNKLNIKRENLTKNEEIKNWSERRFLKLAITLGLSIFSVHFVSGADLIFDGGSLPALSYPADKNTGLEKIYVIYDTDGVAASYTAAGGLSSNVKWYRFSNLGGGFAEEITDVSYDGATSKITKVDPDSGYIIEEGETRYCFWVVGYKDKRLALRGLAPSAEQDCDMTLLDVVGTGDAIHYYTINGQQRTLSRELHLAWQSLEWDGSAKLYRTVDRSQDFEYLSNPLVVRPAALATTSFTLTGDRFLEAWRWDESVESEVIAPHAVAVTTEAAQADAVQSEEDLGSNVLRTETDGLGGSAPATIDFYAYVSDAVIHHEWQMAEDQDFEQITYRFNQQDLNYTFSEEGVFYLRYVGSNEDGSCEAYGDVYTVSIGVSDLLCPNAFSPNGDGVNDEWKVAYRSLLEFKCWIFNRYGTELCYFEDPSLGWDGKYKGKSVPPGVYYYVIQAVGADGKKYKKSGDINIVRRKIQGGTEGGGVDDTTE